MGLFDRFSKRKDAEEESVAGYESMRVEIMDEDGKLLFVARVILSQTDRMELQPITVPRLAPNTLNLPVLLRGYDDTEKKAIHMSGDLSARSNGLWRVDSIAIVGKDNDRAFYRQDTTLSGEITPMQQTGVYSEPCRLINISAGGVCFLADVECREGERILLRSNLLEGWSLTPLVCVVRRVTKRKIGFEYGCEFTDLTPATEDIIAKAIMEMQVKRRRTE